MFEEIALREGSLNTKWGPCTCWYEGEYCKSCQNAEAVELAGLDWDEEYEKARTRDFDRNEITT